jgi:cysteine desulfurase
MRDSPLYFDHNATTPIHPDVMEAMARAARDLLGNPASQHAPGRKARRVLEECREGILALLGAQTSGMEADRLIFTSGGTEANNLAIFGLGFQPGAGAGTRDLRPLVVSAIEHQSVMGAADELARRGHQVVKLLPTSDGLITADTLRSALDRLHSPRLVSVMLASNETGVIQPAGELAAVCQSAGVPFHTDAAQAVGKIPVSFRGLGASAMTVAPHKFHGPLGIGALVLRHGVSLAPLLYGGFQQSALRPGTEPVVLAVGFLTALKRWHDEAAARLERMQHLRDRLEHLLTCGAPACVIVGSAAPRLPQTTCVAFSGVNRQALVMALDVAGVACSTGSACASGSSEPSPALAAMGLERELIEGAIRLSWGALTTAEEVEEAARRILKCVKQLRRDK